MIQLTLFITNINTQLTVNARQSISMSIININNVRPILNMYYVTGKPLLWRRIYKSTKGLKDAKAHRSRVPGCQASNLTF